MSLRVCKCRVPNQHLNPIRPDSCVQCGFHIPPEWTSSDQTVGEFLERLAEAVFPGHFATGEAPEWFDTFSDHLRERELAGRDYFGHRCLGRENAADGMEEAVDGALYSLYEMLVRRRAGKDEERSLALTAAWHFAQAHWALQLLQANRHLPYSEELIQN